MADSEHVKVVWGGKKAIALWRKQHRKECLDLSGAHLGDANLRDANLRGANLVSADLSEADLSKADFSKVNLSGADLSKAELFQTNFIGADLHMAELFLTNLSGANLNGVDLFEANLYLADLSGADLSRANLFIANLRGANLAQAICSLMSFADYDLHQVTNLVEVVHEGPSTIGIDTVINSFRSAGNRLTPELNTFFKGAGVPKEFLDALPRIVAKVKYCSCFISYGEPEKEFAQKLCRDLEASGISCWLYSMDNTPGEKTWREIGQKRREADKMLVLCSAKALLRDGVLKEIEEQIDEDPDKMVPVSRDDVWTEPNFPVKRGSRDLKPFLYPVLNYVDFSDSSVYDISIERLLKGLERTQVKRKKPRKQT